MITPQQKANKIAKKIGLNTDLFLKREDLHPLGSHKGRSLPLMIEKYFGDGVRNFVISSSGNAALAAAKYISDHNSTHANKIKLEIFVGKNIDSAKWEILKQSTNHDPAISIAQVSNPKQSAFQREKNTNPTSGLVKNLRQSTDETALLGYEELARELAEIKNLSAVFIPTSSGTLAEGLYDGFQKLNINPQIHIVQTTACHPLVTNENIPTTLHSLAAAIVDKVAHRKNKILELLKNSRGNGWVATDPEIKNAIELIQQTEYIDISPNSALALVGLELALASGQKFSGPVVCILTGR